MQIELTRKHKRDFIKDLEHGQQNSGNEVHLDCTGLNRGESEFFYESLMTFLNNADKQMERYFVKRDLAILKKKEESPERAILAEILIRTGKSPRLSNQDKLAINAMVGELKTIFEGLR